MLRRDEGQKSHERGVCTHQLRGLTLAARLVRCSERWMTSRWCRGKGDSGYVRRKKRKCLDEKVEKGRVGGAVNTVNTVKARRAMIVCAAGAGG